MQLLKENFVIIEQQLKIGYERTQPIFSFIFIKSEYTRTRTHEIKKIMVTITLIFHYQVRQIRVISFLRIEENR